MPSPSNLPLSFNRDRAARQLDARLEELLEKLRKNRPSEDPWMVRRAYEIATERHHDQFRSSGEPYLSHLLEVAHILADMRLDATTLTAATCSRGPITASAVRIISSASLPCVATTTPIMGRNVTQRRPFRRKAEVCPRNGQTCSRRSWEHAEKA